jgi:hypothetical protein
MTLWCNGGFSFRLVPVAELYFLCRVTFHSAHFTNDRHRDHIPILLQYCGSCPCVCHDPYLPSISASLQTPGRAELVTILTIPHLFQGSSPLSFTLFSQRLLEVQKFDSERYHQSSHSRWDPVHTHKSRPWPPFPSRHITSSLELDSNFFFPRACQTLGSRRPPCPLEIRVCQTLTPQQSILQDES